MIALQDIRPLLTQRSVTAFVDTLYGSDRVPHRGVLVHDIALAIAEHLDLHRALYGQEGVDGRKVQQAAATELHRRAVATMSAQTRYRQDRSVVIKFLEHLLGEKIYLPWEYEAIEREQLARRSVVPDAIIDFSPSWVGLARAIIREPDLPRHRLLVAIWRDKRAGKKLLRALKIKEEQLTELVHDITRKAYGTRLTVGQFRAISIGVKPELSSMAKMRAHRTTLLRRLHEEKYEPRQYTRKSVVTPPYFVLAGEPGSKHSGSKSPARRSRDAKRPQVGVAGGR
jgi:hypothetical protein